MKISKNNVFQILKIFEIFNIFPYTPFSKLCLVTSSMDRTVKVFSIEAWFLYKKIRKILLQFLYLSGTPTLQTARDTTNMYVKILIFLIFLVNKHASGFLKSTTFTAGAAKPTETRFTYSGWCWRSLFLQVRQTHMKILILKKCAKMVTLPIKM